MSTLPTRTAVLYFDTVCCDLIPSVIFVCSLTVRPGGDDGLGKLERTSSLRLPVLEHGLLDTSTPQEEDLPSPLGSQSSTNMVLKTFFNCMVCARLDLFTSHVYFVSPLAGWLSQHLHSAAQSCSLSAPPHPRTSFQALLAFSWPQRQREQRVRAEWFGEHRGR